MENTNSMFRSHASIASDAGLERHEMYRKQSRLWREFQIQYHVRLPQLQLFAHLLPNTHIIRPATPLHTMNALKHVILCCMTVAETNKHSTWKIECRKQLNFVRQIFPNQEPEPTNIPEVSAEWTNTLFVSPWASVVTTYRDNVEGFIIKVKTILGDFSLESGDIILSNNNMHQFSKAQIMSWITGSNGWRSEIEPGSIHELAHSNCKSCCTLPKRVRNLIKTYFLQWNQNFHIPIEQTDDDVVMNSDSDLSATSAASAYNPHSSSSSSSSSYSILTQQQKEELLQPTRLVNTPPETSAEKNKQMLIAIENAGLDMLQTSFHRASLVHLKQTHPGFAFDFDSVVFHHRRYKVLMTGNHPPAVVDIIINGNQLTLRSVDMTFRNFEANILNKSLLDSLFILLPSVSSNGVLYVKDLFFATDFSYYINILSGLFLHHGCEPLDNTNMLDEAFDGIRMALSTANDEDSIKNNVFLSSGIKDAHDFLETGSDSKQILQHKAFIFSTSYNTSRKLEDRDDVTKCESNFTSIQSCETQALDSRPECIQTCNKILVHTIDSIVSGLKNNDTITLELFDNDWVRIEVEFCSEVIKINFLFRSVQNRQNIVGIFLYQPKAFKRRFVPDVVLEKFPDVWSIPLDLRLRLQYLYRYFYLDRNPNESNSDIILYGSPNKWDFHSDLETFITRLEEGKSFDEARSNQVIYDKDSRRHRAIRAVFNLFPFHSHTSFVSNLLDTQNKNLSVHQRLLILMRPIMRNNILIAERFNKNTPNDFVERMNTSQDLFMVVDIPQINKQFQFHTKTLTWEIPYITTRLKLECHRIVKDTLFQKKHLIAQDQSILTPYLSWLDIAIKITQHQCYELSNNPLNQAYFIELYNAAIKSSSSVIVKR